MTQHKVYLQRIFSCSAEELFRWLVQPERIAQWFGPRYFTVEEVETDVRVGGSYRIGLRRSEQIAFLIEGEYLDIQIPHLLRFSLDYQGLAGQPPSSTVSLRLEALSDTQTRLSLVQEFAFVPSNLPERTQAWEHMLKELEKLLLMK